MDFAAARAFPAGDGEQAAHVRSRDWAATPLGPLETWPAPLRAAVQLTLDSPAPVLLGWGEPLTAICNEACAPLLGGHFTTALGAALAEIWPASWEPLAPLAETVRGGQAVSLRDCPAGGEGAQTWWSFTFAPLRAENGDIQGLLGFGAETTAHHQAAAAHRASAHRDRQILDSAIDYAIIGFNLEGRATSWNEGARRIFGWTADDIIGQPADRIFTPEDVAAGVPAREMGNALRDGRGSDERWHVRKDGSRFYGSGEMMVLRDEAGAAAGFIKILRDRTEQRRAIVALRDSEERVETALGTGLIGFFDWDVRAGLLRADAHFAAFYGLDAAQLRAGMELDSVLAAVHPQDRGAVATQLRQAVSNCEEYTQQYRTIHPTGATGSVLVRGHCYERDESSAHRFTGIAVDLSATLKAEEALRASEAFNRHVLASSGDCIKVLDLEGRLLFMSEGGMRTMEVDDLSHVQGSSWPDFWQGREHRLVLDAMATARAGGRAHFQGYANTAKGNRRFWDVMVTPMLDAAGQPERLLAISRDVTEAHATAERIDLALNAGAVLGTWLWDVPKDRITGDRRFARAFSLDPDKLAAGLPLSEVVSPIHPDDMPRVEAAIGKAVAQGGRYRAEFRIRKPDGAWLWIEANGHCDLDEAGQALRFPGVLIDIDHRKRQELNQAALIDLGNRLRDARSIPEMAAIAAEILGQTTGVARAGYGAVDPARETVTITEGWSAAPDIHPIAGVYAFRDFGSYIDELKRDETVAIPNIARDPRTSAATANFAALRITGLLNVPLLEDESLAAVVLLHTIQPHAWSDDEISFARAIADRTWSAMRQARAEARLQRINETLEQQVAERTADRNRLWQLSRDIMTVATFEGVITAVNPAWTDLLGWRADELIGGSIYDLTHPDDAARAVEAARALAASARPLRHLELRFRHKDGSFRWISWTAAPGDGFIIGVGRDITDEKEQAEALRVTEEALRQSQKMEAVGQLTGGLAHDFNNLLTGVTGSLELMQTRIAQGRIGELDRYITAAQGAARRAAALTHRLLAFSRRQTLDPKPTDINQLVAGMDDLVRRTVGPAIAVETAPAPGLWLTLVDQGQLENALLNLCINARDAMPDGGRITVETANRWLDEPAARERDMPTGQYVSLCVTDTGTGMPPDVIARAFEPFFTTKPLGAGTGLGLSMIYGFVRQSGGQVRIHSQVGHGTTVCFYLPRHFSSAEMEEAPPLPVETPIARDGETVLVVDDEHSVRLPVRDALEDLGYIVLEAPDGATGLRILQSAPRMDLLITDVGLTGGMNGRQLADAARVTRPNLKILFITGYAENALITHSHVDPGMQVLTKPFTMEMLANRIKDLISK